MSTPAPRSPTHRMGRDSSGRSDRATAAAAARARQAPPGRSRRAAQGWPSTLLLVLFVLLTLAALVSASSSCAAWERGRGFAAWSMFARYRGSWEGVMVG